MTTSGPNKPSQGGTMGLENDRESIENDREPVKLVPGKSDKEYADELKIRLVEAYKPLIAILQEAASNEWIVNATVGRNQVTNKIDLIALQIMKGY